MARPFDFDRAWRFDVPVESLWATVADTGRFPALFPWLRADALPPLAEGATARFQVVPPLPYRLHLAVHVREVVPCERVVTTVEGDLSGPAHLEVAPDGDGATARLVWSLTLERPLLRGLERVARPAMVWGHDAVVARGLERFRIAMQGRV